MLAGAKLERPIELVNVLELGLKSKPHETALVSLERTWSWWELEQASTQLAGQYLALGLAPSWTATDIDGRRWSGQDLRGQVVIVDFWATWCAPCLDELPRLKRLHERHRANGLTIIGVGINWAAGGVGNPDYGDPVYLGVSFAVLIFILLITRFVKGFFSNIAVLLGEGDE